MRTISNKQLSLCVYLLLALTTIAVFWQVCSFDFVNYDDPGYVTENQHTQTGLTVDNVIWAFTSGHMSNWHPLTWLSHMLDCQLFAAAPGWHHLINLLFHIANTLLLFLILKQMTGIIWPSAFVAACFALHPLHVESVAWIAERKDVLSTFFWMLTIAAYVYYVKKPSVRSYFITLIFFALGLMTKPMLVTLPFVLLLLDYWPLVRFDLNKNNEKDNRIQGNYVNRLIIEKIPFFFLSVVSSVVTFYVQQTSGAVAKFEAVSLNIRIANAFISYAKYIGKMFLPIKLATPYPHPGDMVPVYLISISVVLFLAVSFFVILLARRHKYLLVGWLWYLGTLVPVIGLVQVGNQAMADRYTYVPLIGLFIIIAFGVNEVCARWQYKKIVLTISACFVLLALAVCTHFQLQHWRSTFSLFEHALDVTENNYTAHVNFGAELVNQQKYDKAIIHFIKARQLKPESADPPNNLGYALMQLDKLDEAIGQFHAAIRAEPNYADAYSNLGYALARKGRLSEAFARHSKALQLKPASADAHKGIADVLFLQGKIDDAIAHYKQALQIRPNFAFAQSNLEYVLANKGRLKQAGQKSQQPPLPKPDSN